jgi:YD repeat-containing protein
MRSLALVAACVLLASCSQPGRYGVQVTGYTGGGPSSIPLGASIAVLPTADAENPLLERQILGTVQQALIAAEYRVLPLDQADVALFVEYGIGSHVESGTTSIYSPGTTTTVRDPAGNVVGKTTTDGTTAYGVPETHNVNDAWLRITAVDARALRESKRREPVWIGVAKRSGGSTDFRQVVGSLLVPVIDVLGNNAPQVYVTVSEDDVRVRALSWP